MQDGSKPIRNDTAAAAAVKDCSVLIATSFLFCVLLFFVCPSVAQQCRYKWRRFVAEGRPSTDDLCNLFLLLLDAAGLKKRDRREGGRGGAGPFGCWCCWPWPLMKSSSPPIRPSFLPFSLSLFFVCPEMVAGRGGREKLIWRKTERIGTIITPSSSSSCGLSLFNPHVISHPLSISSLRIQFNRDKLEDTFPYTGKINF